VVGLNQAVEGVVGVPDDTGGGEVLVQPEPGMRSVPR
jgi:hypothetical protein